MSKLHFTDYYLSAMLRAATGGQILRVRYACPDPEAPEEEVTVYFDNGYTKKVNVTADSLLAIAFDAMKAVR